MFLDDKRSCLQNLPCSTMYQFHGPEAVGLFDMSSIACYYPICIKYVNNTSEYSNAVQSLRREIPASANL